MIRRNLQREDLRIMTTMLLHPAPTTPPDARSLMRMNAQSLVAELKAAQGKPGVFEGSEGAHRGEPRHAAGSAQGADAARELTGRS